MPVAAELARDANMPSGVVVVAEEQTSGRGRRRRSWHAPYGSALLVSIVLKAPHVQHPASTLSMIAGNALLAAVGAVVPAIAGELKLKWPNDLVVGTLAAQARKSAGILAESSLAPDGSLLHAVIGIGINVNQQANELPRIAPPTPRPTSLRIANSLAISDRSSSDKSSSDPLIDRSLLLVHLCRQFAHTLALPPTENYQLWKTHLTTLGQPVAVYQHGVENRATVTGEAVDVQEDGALIVVDTSGTRHTFHAADVSIRIP
jgi:BirA family biotin operon repressor/biotin-[acetyl-CoA-carboxylase] ligase